MQQNNGAENNMTSFKSIEHGDPFMFNGEFFIKNDDFTAIDEKNVLKHMPRHAWVEKIKEEVEN